MKKSIPMGLISAAVAGLFAVATPTFATPVTQTIDVGQVFTGATPNGQAPWLTATFMYDNDGSSHVGTLTLYSNLTDGNFLQGGNGNGVMGWGFNLDGNSLTGYDCTSGTCATQVGTGSVNSGPVPGGFNLGFGWTSQDRFDGSDTATYSLTFADMLTTSPFMANGDGYLSFAHVQGITGSDDSSGFIVDDPVVQPVPEPAALGMFGLGVLVLGIFVGLRRRFS
ncbi:MAG TPA: PEP-CTERM sorting domain-containing protein [Rhodanobacteraceae bacterium]|nr:PEP-CTERM sorting domain-containing protein [Rhodanobacteraceae bacterium]